MQDERSFQESLTRNSPTILSVQASTTSSLSCQRTSLSNSAESPTSISWLILIIHQNLSSLRLSVSCSVLKKSPSQEVLLISLLLWLSSFWSLPWKIFMKISVDIVPIVRKITKLAWHTMLKLLSWKEKAGINYESVILSRFSFGDISFIHLDR